MSLAARLDRALQAAGIPILGVSIGSEFDKATWRIDFLSQATPAQRAQAELLKQNFEPGAPDPASVEANAVAAFDQQKLVKALGIWTAQKLGIALAQARNEILAIYKGL